MSENEDQSPFGRGFIAACIVIGAVLLCGAVLIITNLTSGPSDASASTTQAAVPGEPPATPTIPAAPATPGAQPAAAPAPTGSANTCNLPDGDQAVPTNPPSVDGWDVSRRVVVPRSSAYGPAKTDPDGFRHCFAHSPTGAVYAAYSAIAAMADQSKVVPTARKLMLPGRATDSLIGELGDDEASTDSSATQLAGYRVVDAGRDRVTVMLAFPVKSVYMSATLTLVWHKGDWRVQPPPPREPVGSPFSQHRDLSDFVKWSGI